MTAQDQLLLDRAHELLGRGQTREARDSLMARARAAEAPAEIHMVLGLAHQLLGEWQPALDSYGRALAAHPGLVGAYNNRGNIWRALRRWPEALADFDRALAAKPDFVEARANRGIVLADMLRHAEAIGEYTRALAQDPNYAPAHSYLGCAQLALRQPQAALASFDRAIALDPRMAEAHGNRGNALRELARPMEAIVSYDRALAIDPTLVPAHNNRAAVLFDLKRYDEAAEGHARALDLQPDQPLTLGHLLKSKLHACDWADLETLRARIGADLDAGKLVIAPFTALMAGLDGAHQRRSAEIYARAQFPVTPPLPFAAPRANGKIRIGYFSADVHHHATAYLMAELFERHDRSRFEITMFSYGSAPEDAMTRRIRAACDAFIDARAMTDDDIHSTARNLGLDIAVDLKGYTAGARLGPLVGRLAPVQAHYLGFPGTLAAPFIDYLIADAEVAPPQARAHFAEKLVILPGTYQVNDTRRAIAPATPSRAALGLPETGFIYCSFNNSYKITPKVFDVWCRVLGRVEGSVLWLLADNAAATRNLRREAERRGLEPRRLVFAPRLGLPDHLSRHRAADLFLDCFDCGAHTGASDALWVGLPVLTLRGATFAGRVAASVLRAADMPDTITDAVADYETLAVALALDPGRLGDLRRRLSEHRDTCALFDAKRFTRHLEAAYAEMWHRHRAGEPPDDIVVTPLN